MPNRTGPFTGADLPPLADGVAEGLGAAADLSTVQRIVRSAARAAARADGATIVLRDVDHCFYADEDAISPLWKGQRFPLTSCISGWAMLHDETVVIPDITVDDRIPLEAYRPTFVKSLAMVPVGTGKPVAAIGAYWAEPHTATPDEVEALEALAAATARAIERIGLFDAVVAPALDADRRGGLTDPVDLGTGGLFMSEDHERIARDLHDTVLQRMFGAGLQLQALARKVDDPGTAGELDGVVTQIDETIRELRGVIFGLEYGHDRLGGVRLGVLSVAAESARALGFKPVVLFEGDEEGVDDALRWELVGALREMLSNVGRHAHASAVTVTCAFGSVVQLVVTDNGVGVTEHHAAGSGLGNLAARAEALGGTFDLASAPGGGTVASWTVPTP